MLLKAVTKKFEDSSTMKQFKFVFFCDCCERASVTSEIEFVSGFRKKFFLTNEEREARAIIYASDHDKAYERANNEALLELNRCEKCGEMVCEYCTVYANDGTIFCKKCSQNKTELA